MFEADGAGASGWWSCPTPAPAPPVQEWPWPGQAGPAPQRVEPDPATASLVSAVDALVAQAPGELAGPVALHRTRTLLCQLGRLELAVGTALLDVEARELFALDAAGTASSWLRQQPAGDGGRLARAQRLGARPHAQAAVASTALGLASADVVCKALDRLPAQTEPGQVEGVLLNAVPEMLGQWIAASAVEAGGDELAADHGRGTGRRRGRSRDRRSGRRLRRAHPSCGERQRGRRRVAPAVGRSAGAPAPANLG